jgi:L-aminopeptidase/D-esterase-like protein
MITDVPGLRVGHWTHAEAATGCTVVLFPEGTVASGEVRGGAPASRETDLLAPTRLMHRLDALLLTGGSAFGLAAADGVMRFCEERGIGAPTPGGAVPIVVGFALFDLGVGDPSVRPGAAEGYRACEEATAGIVPLGPVGAGTGATVGVVGAAGERRAGGLASVTVRSGDLVVSSLVAVNAFGAPDADDASATTLVDAYAELGLWPAPFGNASAGAGTAAPGTPATGTAGMTTDGGAVRGAAGPGATGSGSEAGAAGRTASPGAAGSGAAGTTTDGGAVWGAGVRGAAGAAEHGIGNTTIGLVATNATLDKVGCHLVAQSAHDGLARGVFPAHTQLDGDAFVAAAVGGVTADVDAVRTLAVHAVASAIRGIGAR